MLKRRLLDEDKMIIWKIRIRIDKMKIIIRLFDYSIDFRIIEYLMPKYDLDNLLMEVGLQLLCNSMLKTFQIEYEGRVPS